jgi:hypothetical protein
LEVIGVADLLPLEVDDDVVREGGSNALKDAGQKDRLSRTLLTADTDHNLGRFPRHELAHGPNPLLSLYFFGLSLVACRRREAHPELIQLGSTRDQEGSAWAAGAGGNRSLPKVVLLAPLPAPLKPGAFPLTDPATDLLDDDMEKGTPFSRAVLRTSFEDPRPVLDEIRDATDPHHLRGAHRLRLVCRFESYPARIEEPADEAPDLFACLDRIAGQR